MEFEIKLKNCEIASKSLCEIYRSDSLKLVFSFFLEQKRLLFETCKNKELSQFIYVNSCHIRQDILKTYKENVRSKNVLGHLLRDLDKISNSKTKSGIFEIILSLFVTFQKISSKRESAEQNKSEIMVRFLSILETLQDFKSFKLNLLKCDLICYIDKLISNYVSIFKCIDKEIITIEKNKNFDFMKKVFKFLESGKVIAAFQAFFKGIIACFTMLKEFAFIFQFQALAEIDLDAYISHFFK